MGWERAWEEQGHGRGQEYGGDERQEHRKGIKAGVWEGHGRARGDNSTGTMGRESAGAWEGEGELEGAGSWEGTAQHEPLRSMSMTRGRNQGG